MIKAIIIILFFIGNIDYAQAKEIDYDPITIQQYIVIDGNTIREKGGDKHLIRLYGIYAPEIDQYCYKDGHVMPSNIYPCGIEAKKYLQSLVENRDILCEYKAKGRYGSRYSAICYSAEGSVYNIGAYMVKFGWALAYKNYEMYRPEHEEAKAAMRGVWQGFFVNPWDYRELKRGDK